MMDALNNIPDVSFTNNISLSDIQEQLIDDYKEEYRKLTGEDVKMSDADPYRMILNACALQYYQMYAFLENMGKMNLLKYSNGNFLDQIAALRGISRLQGSKAVCTIQFELEETRTIDTEIPFGTRLSAGEYYFSTKDYATIKAGELYVQVEAECNEVGEEGNNFDIGEINTLIDSVPFISTAKNITKPTGGVGVEDDESFTERIYLAPSMYSVAGPEDGYKYFVKEFNSLISDVNVTSPNPVEVDIRFVMKDGELPSEELIKEVKDYISAKDKRPLTDYVTVGAPEVEEYNVNITYYIGESNRSIANQIKTEVEKAIEEYIVWQNTEIGRDINPSELTKRVLVAGAKRAVIQEPVYTKVDDVKIAKIKEKTVTYGGIEDD